MERKSCRTCDASTVPWWQRRCRRGCYAVECQRKGYSRWYPISKAQRAKRAA